MLLEKRTHHLRDNCDIRSQGIKVELTGQDAIVEHIPFRKNTAQEGQSKRTLKAVKSTARLMI